MNRWDVDGAHSPATNQSLRATDRLPADAKACGGRRRGRPTRPHKSPSRLNREGFRPPSGRVDRFTPELARGLVHRLGLGPTRRPAELLSADEWWGRDLADELGVGYHRFKECVTKGYVHVRRVGGRGHLVIWADAEERGRLCQLRDHFRPGRTSRYPAELTRPKSRSHHASGRRGRDLLRNDANVPKS